MIIANLPPSNHINLLAAFISRIRRTRNIPTAQELSHAEDSITSLQKTVATAGECCPFCGEHDFDLSGLKGHLSNGDCAPFNEIECMRRMF